MDVAAVAGLGHCETAKQFEIDDLPDPLPVPFGAEVLDGPAEQTPLHARLHHQGQVGHREHLDLGDRASDIAVAAVLLLEAVLRAPWAAMIRNCSPTLVRAITVFGV